MDRAHKITIVYCVAVVSIGVLLILAFMNHYLPDFCFLEGEARREGETWCTCGDQTNLEGYLLVDENEEWLTYVFTNCQPCLWHLGKTPQEGTSIKVLQLAFVKWGINMDARGIYVAF